MGAIDTDKIASQHTYISSTFLVSHIFFYVHKANPVKLQYTSRHSASDFHFRKYKRRKNELQDTFVLWTYRTIQKRVTRDLFRGGHKLTTYHRPTKANKKG